MRNPRCRDHPDILCFWLSYFTAFLLFILQAINP
jgi:hypothetical protein